MKFYNTNTFIQTSEDLNMRIFDIRCNGNYFNVSQYTKTGDNFVNTLDIQNNDIITGHCG